MKISGVVVLYNPDSAVLQNIKSYYNQIDYLFVIDNSTNCKEEIINEIKKIENIEYVNNNKNLGIAAALNIGAKKSIERGFEFLLTMDQDSYAHPDIVKIMLSKKKHFSNPGIISPHHQNVHFKPTKSNADLEELEVVITSGNLLNLKAYQDVGGFDEALFIDYVDIDMCLKLKINGYNIYKVNSAILKHNEGNLRTIQLLNKKFRPYNHNPFRWYYKIRNFNYLKDKYFFLFPSYFKEEKKRIKNDLLKILLFEKGKFKKLNFVIRGYSDYKKGILGKIPESYLRK